MSLGFEAWNVVRKRTVELLLKNSPLQQDGKLLQKYINQPNIYLKSIPCNLNNTFSLSLYIVQSNRAPKGHNDAFAS